MREFSIEEGVYWLCRGPSFETPAEIRAFRTLGATLVGMSTVPETIVARHMGIEVLGISCVTNKAAGLNAQPLSHEEVFETGRLVERTAFGRAGAAGGVDLDTDGSRVVSEASAGERTGRRPRLPFPPVVLGIAGASGSGKTTLALELARDAGRNSFSSRQLLSRSVAFAAWKSGSRQNFDDPALIESSLLARHVAALARGETIERPLYDFATYIRDRGTRRSRCALGRS